MKEHEMWQTVRRILARTVVPASLGLALAGCGDRAAVPVTDGGVGDGVAAEMYPAPAYGAPQPDYAAPWPAPMYAAAQPDLGDPHERYAAPRPDLGDPQADYAAPFPEPDAG